MSIYKVLAIFGVGIMAIGGVLLTLDVINNDSYKSNLLLIVVGLLIVLSMALSQMHNKSSRR